MVDLNITRIDQLSFQSINTTTTNQRHHHYHHDLISTASSKTLNQLDATNSHYISSADNATHHHRHSHPLLSPQSTTPSSLPLLRVKMSYPKHHQRIQLRPSPTSGTEFVTFLV
ncbi:hypothetical protein L1887_02087 [Cichorium endivia]|nr:hypothetical protein L1887_02087 [Cichorium endivia]